MNTKRGGGGSGGGVGGGGGGDRGGYIVKYSKLTVLETIGEGAYGEVFK